MGFVTYGQETYVPYVSLSALTSLFRDAGRAARLPQSARSARLNRGQLRHCYSWRPVASK